MSTPVTAETAPVAQSSASSPASSPSSHASGPSSSPPSSASPLSLSDLSFSEPSIPVAGGPPPIPVLDPVEAAEQAALDAWIGQIIAGKYRVDEVIGRGGMGVVLRARHLALDEPVAIKVLRPAMMAVPGMVTRFLREARAASKIKSDHVVRVTDVDSLPTGVPYLVMEYLEGTDLAAVLREQGRLSVDLAARYVIEACDAIDEAHGLGIVHRDLKPGNLFLSRRRDGKSLVKVLDFGISKVDGSEQDTTRTGTMMGSPKFMAPEQMMSMHDVDGRADVWALGAILYDLLTGAPPFVASTTPQVCALVLHAEPVAPLAQRPDIPAELEAIVLRCLRKNPAQRFDSADELRRALFPFCPSLAFRESMSLPPGERRFSNLPEPAASAPASSTTTPSAGSRTTGPHTTMSTAVDAASSSGRLRVSGLVLGGLGLALALGLGVVFAAQRAPQPASAPPHAAAASDAPAAGTTSPTPGETAGAPGTGAPAGATSNAPAGTPPAMAAALSPPGAAAASAPSARPLAPKKPLPGDRKKTGTSAASDPFGGSRN